MTKQFNEIPKDHPAYNPEKRLFRFHSGETVHESVARAMEVTDIESVKTLIRARGLPFETVTVEPYAYDDRIEWLTYLVCIDGKAVGYTNHSLIDEIQVNLRTANPELRLAQFLDVESHAYQIFQKQVVEYQKEHYLPMQMYMGDFKLCNDALEVNGNLLLTTPLLNKWALVDVTFDHINHPTAMDHEFKPIPKLPKIVFHTGKAVENLAKKALTDFWG